MKFSALIYMMLLFLVWYSAGYWIFRLLRLENSPEEKIVIYPLTGFGITANVFTLFGILQQLNHIWILSVFVFILISGIFGPFKDFSKCLRIKTGWVKNIFFIISLSFLIIYFIKSLFPPTGIDGLMYHLSVPRLYLEHGGFFPVPWNNQSDLPMLGEMNYLAGTVLKNPVLCRLIGFFTGLMASGVLILMSIDLIPKKNILFLPLLIFVSHTNTVPGFSSCNTDMLTCAYTLGAVWFFRRIRTDTGEKVSPLCLAGYSDHIIKYYIFGILLLCFAVQSKPFGVLLILPSSVYLLWKLRGLKRGRYLLVFMAAAVPLAAGSVWYIKSSLFTGMPIQSIDRVIPETADSGFLLMDVFQTVTRKSTLLLKNIISAPWSYSLFPLMHRNNCFGPLFIGIMPFAFFVKRNRRFYGYLFWGISIWGMFILLSTAMGKQGGLSIRYMTSVIAIFSILTVYVYERLGQKNIKKLILISIIFYVAVNFIVTLKRYRGDILSFVQMENSHEYLMESYDLYPAIDYINRELSPESFILAGCTFGTYYINRNYICATKKYSSSVEMISAYKEKGITHIFVNNVLDTEGNKNAWFGGSGLEKIFSKNGYIIYKIP